MMPLNCLSNGTDTDMTMEQVTEFIRIIIDAARQGKLPCLFHVLTGAYCPGCGGTRAVQALLKGHIFQSFLLHPLVPYLAVAVPCLIVWYIRCRKKKKPFSQNIWQGVLFAGIFLLTANFLIKNYFLLFLGRDLLAACGV